MADVATIDGAWSLQRMNNAVQGRLMIGTGLMQANPVSEALQPMQTWRSGVLPAASYITGGSGAYDGLVIEASPAALKVRVYPGTFVINRPGQGPYVAWSTAVVTLDLVDADTSFGRIDLVVAEVLDAGIGDSASVARLRVITGTPASVPTAPDTPAAAIPLGQVVVAANASSVSNPNIVDVRKSTGPLGGTRLLLPGDDVDEGGYVVGERRMRLASGALPDLVDVWGSDGQWHGTQSLRFTASIVNGSDTGDGTVMAQVNIPDPGWPYYVSSTASLWMTVDTNAGGRNLYAALNTGEHTSQLINKYGVPIGETMMQVVPRIAGPITGARTCSLASDDWDNTGKQVQWRSTDGQLAVFVDPA